MVEAFLVDGQRRNHTPATLSAYRWALLGTRMRTYLDDNGIVSVGRFTAEHLRGYESELQQAGLSAATVHQTHRSLKTFLRYCQRRGYEVDAAFVEVQGPKLAQVEPDVFTVEEERRLLAAARTKRDKILVEFMLRTGLRLSEVVSVAVNDVVDLGNQGAYVVVRQGKGRKDRHVPLDDAMYRRLRVYMDRHRPAHSDALFPAARGRGRPLSAEALQSLLVRLGTEAGVHCNAHKFRHTFASRAIADGVDPLTLQRVLGHATLLMVNRYVHFSPTSLLRSWRRRGRPQDGNR